MLQAEKRFVMTRITKITACLICICAVFGTASCGKKASLPDVRDLGQILTVSREEGSGTRTEFDMNLKVTEQNADQVVSSTKDMLETVASTKNAIGYVAYSAIANELDSGITADDKTDKLSLSRQSADYMYNSLKQSFAPLGSEVCSRYYIPNTDMGRYTFNMTELQKFVHQLKGKTE